MTFPGLSCGKFADSTAIYQEERRRTKSSKFAFKIQPSVLMLYKQNKQFCVGMRWERADRQVKCLDQHAQGSKETPRNKLHTKG